MAACIEQNNDEHGIMFPPPLAPFEVLIINLDPKNEAVNAKCEELYACIQEKNIDVLYDDREERPGVKFKDADLIGVPLQLIVGGKGLEKGIVETKIRKIGQKSSISADNAAAEFDTLYQEMLNAWK